VKPPARRRDHGLLGAVRGGSPYPPRRAARERGLAARWGPTPTAQQPDETHLSPRKAIATAALILTVLLAGCRPGAHNRVRHYVALDAIRSANRVVLLPLANQTDSPGIEEGLEAELLGAIQRRRLFQLQEVAREPGARQVLLDPGRRTYTEQDLVAIRKASGADAVLIGLVNRWQPYPRMQVGLYLRLVDLRSGRLLWAVDHVWDATNEHTQRRIATFFHREMGAGAEPFDWQLGTVSPRAFQKFVAWEVAGTLPRRVARPAGSGSQVRASRNLRKNPRP